jgi:branched-chain amino acid transport system substrate-binding protein
VNRLNRTLVGAALAALLGASGAVAQSKEPIRLAFIDPMTGPSAILGEGALRRYTYFIDRINAAGGVLGGRKLEMTVFDNKNSVEETLILMKKVLDQGYHYIFQGNSSPVAYALSAALEKNYQRNPRQAALHINISATDNGLTEDKCNWWHFRMVAPVHVMMRALVGHVAAQKGVKKVYLINGDFAFGHSFNADAKRLLAELAPNVQVVGEDLVPFQKVNDYTPYIAKMSAAGADAILTGHFGRDLALMSKAARSADFKARWYTFFAGQAGGVSAIGESGVGLVKQIGEWDVDARNKEWQEIAADFRRKMNDDFVSARTKYLFDMLVKAWEAAGTDDPVKVSKALSGMKIKSPEGMDVILRADNHNLAMPLYISTMVADPKIPMEGTGFGFRLDATIPTEASLGPTACKFTAPK